MTYTLMAEDHSFFGKLPPEVICDVFKCLTIPDRLNNCRFVCQRWSVLAPYGLRFLPKLTDSSVTNVLNCGQKVETLLAKNLIRPLPISCRRSCRRDAETVLNINFDRLKRIFFECNISPSNMTKLLEKAQAVEILGFTGFISPFPIGVSFNNLNCIQFQKMDLQKKQLDYLISLLNISHFPLLKRANFVNVECSDIRLYFAVHRFVLNHRKSIKNLIFCAAPRIVMTGVIDPSLKTYYESHEEYVQLLTDLNQVQLETLWVNAVNYEGQCPFNLSTRLIEVQEKLECLLIDGIYFWNAIQCGQIALNQTIKRNCRTLRRLKLPLLSFDCVLVNHCEHLKEIGVFLCGEQLDSWGLNIWDSTLTNIHNLPKTLKIIDLHLPVEMQQILWISQNIQVHEIIFAGTLGEQWDMNCLKRVWRCPTLVRCHCWVKISRYHAQRVLAYSTRTRGIEADVVFEANNRRALVEAKFNRPRNQNS